MKYNFLVLNTCDIDRFILRTKIRESFPNSSIKECFNHNLSAMEIAKSNNYDLIIIDTNILNAGASDTIFKNIRDTGYTKGIITITNFADYNSIKELKLEGSDEVITKPFKFKLLTDAIHKYCYNKKNNPLYYYSYL